MSSAGAPSLRLPERRPLERLGIVSYANVAPLHWGLEPWDEPGSRAAFVRGVPTELNRRLLEGGIDLTLVSSVEFLRHRRRLVALPDFSISTLGPVHSVLLFHWRPLEELAGTRISVTDQSSTSVELLRLLLGALEPAPELLATAGGLEAMLADREAALLIGDAALQEGLARRPIAGRRPLVTDLGELWYLQTRLPFTFAVWAARADRPPSRLLVARLRAAREAGLGHLAEVAESEAARLGMAREPVQRYLHNFRYYLQPPDRDGLLEFGRRLLGSLAAEELRFWEG